MAKKMYIMMHMTNFDLKYFATLASYTPYASGVSFELMTLEESINYNGRVVI